MSEVLKSWIDIVKNKLQEEQLSQSDLAKLVGVSKTSITELFRYGKGSERLKLAISKELKIGAPWKGNA